MKRLLVVAVCLTLFVLPGCATWDAAQKVVAERGAKLADEELETIKWGLCKKITVGAWVREFGRSPMLADGWRRLCGAEITEVPK